MKTNSAYDSATALELIAAYRDAGDVDAMEQLTNRYLERVYAYFRSQVSNKNDVDDLVQTAFLKLLRAATSNESIENVTNYLFIICKNCLRDFFRRKKQARRLLSSNTDDMVRSVLELSNASWQKNFGRTLPSLDDLERILTECENTFADQRVRLIIRGYIHGDSLDEIASATGCPVGTVGSLWHRNKKKLFTCFLEKLHEII